jgi:hypothetical protein
LTELLIIHCGQHSYLDFSHGLPKRCPGACPALLSKIASAKTSLASQPDALHYFVFTLSHPTVCPALLLLDSLAKLEGTTTPTPTVMSQAFGQRAESKCFRLVPKL